MKFTTLCVALVLVMVLVTGSLEARTPTLCQNALAMCQNWCGSHFSGDGFLDQMTRNGCWLGCYSGYADCVLTA
jgi:hypothetical protein